MSVIEFCKPRYKRGLPLAERFWGWVEKRGPDECWLWKGGADKVGYGFFHNKTLMRAHRVAYELTAGPIPKGMFVCHRCDNPPCCNPSHLFVGTHQDNTDDRAVKGRYAQKLTPAQVIEIRASSEPSLVAAQRYGVSRAYITDLRRGHYWGHLLGVG